MENERGPREPSRTRDSCAILERCHLFAGLERPVLERVAAISLVRAIRKGQTLFCEGDDADGFYIVGEGCIKVFKRSPGGREHILHLFRRGQVVAEAAVFDGGAFPAHAAALEEGQVVFIFKSEFLRLLRENPKLILKILAGITGKLREFATTIEELSLKDVSARLARYLLNNCDLNQRQPVCRLGIPKAQLAARIGTVNETLSRTLTRLKLKGLIAETNAGIVLLEPQALRDVMENGST